MAQGVLDPKPWFFDCFTPSISPPGLQTMSENEISQIVMALWALLFRIFFSILIFDHLLIPFLINLGPKMAPKIDPKSIKHRLNKWSCFCYHFGRVKISKYVSFGIPQPSESMVSYTRNDDFHFLYKSFILTILDHIWLHFGSLWGSKLALFGIKKSIKSVMFFGIDF